MHFWLEAVMEAPIMFEKFWFDLIWSQIWTQDSQDCERYFCAMPVPHQKSRKYKCRVFKKSLIESKFEPEVIFFQIKFLLFRKSNLTFLAEQKKKLHLRLNFFRNFICLSLWILKLESFFHWMIRPRNRFIAERHKYLRGWETIGTLRSCVDVEESPIGWML